MTALMFDLDGTLWDSTAVCAKAWNDLISKETNYDFRITAEDMASIMGLTSEEFREKLLPALSPEEGRSLMKRCFDSEVKFLYKEGAKLYPGVIDGIKKLSKTHALYLVSNCHPEYLDAFLDTTKLRSHFKDHECYGATGRPKGENITSVMKRNNIESAIYCGDTMGDQTGARQAGASFLFCEYGFGKCDDFDYSAKDFNELIKILLSKS